MSLATVNFGLFSDGTQEQKKAAADQLVDSLRTTGFAKLVNTGIPSDVIRESEIWVCRRLSIELYISPTRMS
jgi:isopenicillin N synthase-like dioxygenase